MKILRKKYDIDKQLGICARLTPPLGRAALKTASALMSAASPKSGGGVNVEKIDSAPCRAWLISSDDAGDSSPCLVYFHGGGFVFKAAPYHFRYAEKYASVCGKVLFADYSLAPSRVYPEQNRECLSLFLWAAENAEKLGIDKNRIAVGGDSAGGCLAADTVFALKDGKAKPCFAMLIYPVLDRRMQTMSMKEFTDTPMWNARLNAKMWEYFDPERRFVSPAEREDFGCFPPTYIETAEFDCLRDEALIFAGKLKNGGVSVFINETKRTVHGYDMARKSDVAAQSLRLRLEALRQAFFKETSNV